MDSIVLGRTNSGMSDATLWTVLELFYFVKE